MDNVQRVCNVRFIAEEVQLIDIDEFVQFMTYQICALCIQKHFG